MRTALLTLLILHSSNMLVVAQAPDESKSTADLSFLIGEWRVTRIYSPDSEGQRILKGTLTCRKALDGQFINCTYDIERPGKVRGLDEVYFNYNSIYGLYESMWLSSTWPVKVLMQGNLEKSAEQMVLKTSAQFPIENDVMEYVQGELTIGTEETKPSSFERKTFIRTSKDEDGVWRHHMTEKAEKM
ncbi:MAG: DUF1579 family protein [Bacteroidota bacterium]